jgi:phage terminase Nu1 subunit (DNA packaging protein)
MMTLEEIDAMVIKNAPTGETVTAAELAPWLGLTVGRVHALGRDGVLPRGDGKRYQLKAAILAYCDHCRSLAKGKATDKELASEKIRLAREQADKIALQNAAARGELLDSRIVASEWRGIVTDLRAAVLAVPSRVASELGFDRKQTIVLDSEIRAAMEAIANDH